MSVEVLGTYFLSVDVSAQLFLNAVQCRLSVPHGPTGIVLKVTKRQYTSDPCGIDTGNFWRGFRLSLFRVGYSGFLISIFSYLLSPLKDSLVNVFSFRFRLFSRQNRVQASKRFKGRVKNLKSQNKWTLRSIISPVKAFLKCFL